MISTGHPSTEAFGKGSEATFAFSANASANDNGPLVKHITGGNSGFRYITPTDNPSRLQPPSETPVLIIGGGPIGLLAGFLLAKRGISSVILERHAQRLGQPKAHAINPRSLEILRQAGLDTAYLRKLGASAEDADAVRFVLSMKGLEIGRLPYERQDKAVTELTPEPLFNLAQPVLENYIWKAALETGLVSIWREWQWQSCTQLEDKTILSTVLDRKTNLEIGITSKYLLGCDGAHARSRDIFQIPFEILDGLPPVPIHYVSVNFNADLSKEKTGTLWFIMTKTAGKRNFIAYDRSSNWVFVTTFNPLETSRDVFTEEYCRFLIDQVSGLNIEILIGEHRD
jgi:2,4-dichlorophenol 6-monooxygenase